MYFTMYQVFRDTQCSENIIILMKHISLKTSIIHSFIHSHHQQSVPDFNVNLNYTKG